ncbi:DUF5339 domain-containing protein [Avibacterium avium]|uniref:DUF5339 domain-containing protein n=1 Tax=Avibacterium avium TaxID=751 RepID=UPI003BF8F9A3
MLTKKTALWVTLITFALIAFPSANAAQQNTVPKQCEKLFTATEKLISQAEKQPGTHTQLNKIKSKLKQSKKQILEMELATQIKSCDVALAKLTSIQQDQDNE